MKTYLITMFVLIHFYCLAQNNPQFTVPVSPNAASIGKFGEFPIGLNTGTINIGIPISKIESNFFNVPISLKYHSQGVRVNEISSAVGLGWSLNAGGVITRVVNGIPDGLSSQQPIRSAEDLHMHRNVDYSYVRGIIYNSVDSKRDDFYVALPNDNFKFYFDTETGEPIIESSKPYLIKVISENKIKVISSEGITFVFGEGSDGTEAIERSTQTSASDPNSRDRFYQNLKLSWYLKEIISSNGLDKIVFDYTSSQTFKDPDVVSNTMLINSKTNYILDNQKSAFYSGNEILLSRIIYEDDVIEFNYEKDRVDLPQNSRLRDIKRYHKGALLFSNVLNQSYFLRTSLGWPGHDLNRMARSDEQKSLKLDAVELFGSDNKVISDYKLDYNSVPLPYRNSYAIDEWGFYNGVDNQSLIPRTLVGVWDHFTAPKGVHFFGNADRNGTNNGDMLAGSLHSITYPTGGKTVFGFSPHSWNSIEKEAVTSQVNVTAQAWGYPNDSCQPSVITNLSDEKTFTVVTDEPYVDAQLHVSFSVAYDTKSNCCTERGSIELIKVMDNSVSSVVKVLRQGTQPWDYEDYDVPVTLEKGAQYRLVAKECAYGGQGVYVEPFAFATVKYEKTEFLDQQKVMYGGGLKIDYITNYSGNNSVTTKKVFEYENVNSLIPNRSRRNYLKNIKVSGTVNQLLVSNGQITYGSFGSTPVAYDKVTSFTSSGSENMGKEISYFENASFRSENPPNIEIKGMDFFHNVNWDDFWNTPNLADHETWQVTSRACLPGDFGIKVDRWSGGRLKLKEIYGAESGVYKKIRAIENLYVNLNVKMNRELEALDISSVATYLFPSGKDSIEMGKMEGVVAYYNTFNSSGLRVLSSSTTIDFLTGGNVVSETQYEYNNKNYLLSETRSMNSEGQEMISKIYYPDDVNKLEGINTIQLGIIDKFKYSGTHPRIAMPILTELFNGSTHIKSSKSTYTEKLGTYMPESLEIASGNSDFEKVSEILEYNSKGIVKKQKDKSEVVQTIVWNNTDTNPLFIITNGDYTQPELPLALDIQTKMSSGVELNDTEIKALREALPNASIISYKYNLKGRLWSIQDPNGVSTFYEYDNIGRLLFTKDHDGNILQKHEYVYND